MPAERSAGVLVLVMRSNVTVLLLMVSSQWPSIDCVRLRREMSRLEVESEMQRIANSR